MTEPDSRRTADDLLRAFVIRQYRAERKDTHLAQCPDLSVADLDARDSAYGCDTGCEYVRLESVLACPHGEREEYEWGEFGDVAMLIDALAAEERAAR